MEILGLAFRSGLYKVFLVTSRGTIMRRALYKKLVIGREM